MKRHRFENILISGLRRSGTTVFWETFRRDPRCRCFDEPFHPDLWQGARENSKGTWTELAEVWSSDGDIFKACSQPIGPLDELHPGLTAGQTRYLRDLFAKAGPVVADCVRTWSKVEALAEVLESTLIIHLVRHPKSWVTAQLLPSSSNPGWRRRVTNLYRRQSFFSRPRVFNNWHYEQIIEHACRQSVEGDRLWRSIEKTPLDVARQPAFRKLLAFWLAAVRRTETQLAQLPPERCMTITMEEFLAAPRLTFSHVYERCGWVLPDDVMFEHVRSSRPAWDAASSLWVDGMRWAGIPEGLWPEGGFSGGAVRHAFRKDGT
ncbi:hypothetical protein Thimo_0996 [Thioflavicoccus mobilis 8321]|uniref:Sulfotransferase family protein n=1 Tax=Thioflavicoccus mobilis 8321 TaxID=765912 RepID=L0GSS4_9GAMM|nr:hypothetical protein [Thioflavicoccus mobilis]AGA89818.1 hypothetical protein Thimo_0996 [Thioflavicoccus mobilis 8321]